MGKSTLRKKVRGREMGHQAFYPLPRFPWGRRGIGTAVVVKICSTYPSLSTRGVAKSPLTSGGYSIKFEQNAEMWRRYGYCYQR